MGITKRDPLGEVPVSPEEMSILYAPQDKEPALFTIPSAAIVPPSL